MLRRRMIEHPAGRRLALNALSEPQDAVRLEEVTSVLPTRNGVEFEDSRLVPFLFGRAYASCVSTTAVKGGTLCLTRP
jgi:hypothetical protein